MKANRTHSVLTLAIIALCISSMSLFASHSPFYTALSTNVFLNDDFEDGDLAGWASTADWTNEAGELKHNLSSVSGESSINFPYATALDLTTESHQWSFCLRNGNWDPSTSNDFVVHLNNTDAAFAGDGYAVGVNQTGSSDLLTLYRYDGGTATDIIVSTLDWEGNTDVCITVSRSPSGVWELQYMVEAPTAGSQISAGTAIDATHTTGTHFGMFFDFSSTRAGFLWLDDVAVQSCPASTSVQFATATATLNETDGTYNLCVDIADESSATATMIDVVLTSGDAALIDNYTTQTLTFAAGSTAQECATITITDDSGCNGNNDFAFALQNVMGGMMAEIGTQSTFAINLADDELTITELAQQGFEGAATDTWAVTETPATYNINSDLWGIVANTGGITGPAEDAMFWGMRDLDNTNGGGAFLHNLDFAATDVSAYDNVVVEFQYYTIGYETSDSLVYEVSFDGTPQGQVNLTQSLAGGSTVGWETVSIPVTGGVSMVSLSISAQQNGGSDYAGVDAVRITGTQCACTADAGDISTDPSITDFNICLGDDLEDATDASVSFIVDYTEGDENDPGTLGNEYLFLLANAAGTLVDVSTTGDFNFAAQTMVGVYNVYGLSYATNNTPDAASTYMNAIAGDADINDIAQIQADDAGAVFCLDLDGNDTAGMPVAVTITEGPEVSAIMGTNPTICGTANGSIAITLTNPDAAATDYTVDYENNGTPASITLTSTENIAASGDFNTLTITGLGAGDYDMFVLTLVSSGCTKAATQMLSLMEPGAPTPTIVDSSDPTTCDGNEGSITIGGLTATLMYSVNYTRDALNISAGPFTADAAGEIILMNLVAGVYNAIMVTETVSGCEGGNLNTNLVGPTSPTINSLTTATVCSADAGTYDLTQHEADVTTDAGTFAWFLGDPATTGTAVATPNSVAVSDGEVYFVSFTDGTTNCESTTSIAITVFSDATITIGTVDCSSSMSYDADFTVSTNTNDVVTVLGTDGIDYTGDLMTSDNVAYTLPNIPSNVGVTITVTRENNTCPAVSESVNVGTGMAASGTPSAATVGDVTFSLPVLSGTSNSQVCADVTVNGFTNIISFQFSVNWDETILSYASTNDAGLANVMTGETMISDGILSVIWNTADFLNGDSQTDGSAIFNICFDLIGNASDVSPLDITDNNVTREVTDNALTVLPFGNTNGVIGINGNGQTCCPADAGDLMPTGAQEICEGSDSPEFSADYTAADETDPNPSMPTGLMISEIRIDQNQSGDPDEFFEIHGTPGASLDGYTYLVIGDGAGGSGVIENVTDLTGSVIPTSGFFVAAMPGFTLGTADLSVGNLDFENSDNVTHLLVQDFTGALQDDLDTDDDGTLDVTPWTAIIDDIALVETVGTGEMIYSTNTVGPDGTFVPAHVYFSSMSGGFLIGEFDPTDAAATDTPNEANEMPEYIYVWLASQDNTATGGTATDIVATEIASNNPPYTATFSGLAAGEYCVNGVSFNGSAADFMAANYATVQEIADAVMASTICADVSIADCIALTVTDLMDVTDIVEGDCSSLDAAGTFVVSFNIAGGIAPITINGEDVTDPAFSLGTITGTGTDVDPYVFMSNAVSSATPYSFTVADASATCSEEVVIAGMKDCDPCTGFMPADDIADITECADETITLTPMGGGKQVAAVPTDLFISEYIEGSSNNKCIEIYNGTGADIDLAAGDYELDIYSNGSAGISSSIDLNGVIVDGDVFVICNTASNSVFTDEADLTTGVLGFNGDDAVVLAKASATIDIFGNIGCDPGSQWSDGNTTQNMTLVRNADVFQGITTDPADTPCEFPTLASEWTGLPSNATQLGSHTFSGLTDLIVDYNYYDTDPTAGGETPIATGAELEITDAIVPTDGTATILYVTAFTTDPACESAPIDVVITRNALPNAMNASLFECADVDGTADFTLENADATVDTDGGNTVTYHATLDDAEMGMAALSSPYNAADATIVFARIEDGNTCASTAEVTLSTVDCGISIADPCACRDNGAVNGNATNQTDGQFDETVSVTAPSGQTWFIQAVVGLFDDASAQPPIAPTPFVTGVAGETLVETPNGDGTSDYTLAGMHIDAQGYSITVSNGTDALSINNQCFYPTLAMLSAPTTACLFTAPFTITGEESNGGVEDLAGFVVTDATGTEVQTATGLEITIDPMTLGTGIYTVEFTFDAGEPGAMDITDPGCTQSITQTFEIEETPSQMSCNNNINISVGPDCMSEITPDMILEGSQSCEDDFEVQIMTNTGQNLGNTTTVAMLGNTYNVRVYHLPTNNFCWGSITVEDKADPTFVCPVVPIQIECFANFDAVPAPIAMDNCDPNPSVTLVDESINDSDPCTPTTITRTYTAIDASGNQSENCAQTIELVAPSAPDFADDITFTCEQYAAFPNITDAAALNPSISDSDISDTDIDVAANTPNSVLQNTGAGLPDIAAGIYCPFGFTSSDEVLATCGNDFKIIRTFTVLNWCTNTLVTTDINGDDNIQIIKIVDNTAPTLTRAGFEVSANVFGIHPQPCRSTDFLFPATVTDNCNDIATIQIFTPIGEANYINGNNGANGGQIPAPGLEIGLHTITYTATDVCGNTASIDVTIEVKDLESPTTVCDQLTTTVLGSNGLATVNATTFDDGSNDNCGIEIMEVRRMNDPCNIPGNTTFGPSVTFCCADVAQSPLTVEFRVIDYFGNANTCMVQVIVEDNIAPVLVSCPSNQSITCDDYANNIQPQLDINNEAVLDQFGTASYTDACIPTMTTNYVSNVNNCGIGTITRTFNATDAFGNTAPQCTQTISVTHVSDFVVEFPADMDLVCEVGENPATDGDFGQPTVFFDDCEMVAISQEDQVFTVEDDACYAIYRTWTAINWCVFDDFGFDAVSESPEVDLPGGSLDTDGDKDARTYQDGLNIGNFPTSSPDGYIQHTQIIKVTDNVAPVITNPGTQDVCITENECMTTVSLPEGMATDCSPNVTFTATSDFGVGFGPFINVAPGTYDVVYTAMDNCGNASSIEFQVEVTDCKAPTPYCVGGLIVELGPVDTDGDGEPDAGEVELWASDFDAGSFDNCSDVQVSFTQDVSVTSRTYTCDSIGTLPVYVWITDDEGNQDVCQTTVLIESVDNVCGEANPSIAGYIEREDGEGVLLSEVMISGNGSNMDMSNDVGFFEVEDLESGYDYTVVPSKNDDHDLGVSTIDLVFIRRHILNEELLDSPYKIIAADANNNQNVTTADVVEIKRLILTSITEYTNNTSWRFVDKYFEFPNPLNPWQTDIPEFHSYNNLDAPVYAADFVGIKVGDVNNSGIINLTGDSGEERSGETLALVADDRQVKAGETFTVPVSLSQDADILGMQWTLDFDKNALEFVEIQADKYLENADFGLSLLSLGAINHSFINKTGTKLDKESLLFNLTFTAQEDGLLSEWLSISSTHLNSEAYLSRTEYAEVILDFNNTYETDNQDATILFQNSPNPFRDGTEIAFYLPETEKVTLIIFDTTGKELWRQNGEFVTGRNTVQLTDSQLNATGILYYRIETGDEVLTRKMIKY